MLENENYAGKPDCHLGLKLHDFRVRKGLKWVLVIHTVDPFLFGANEPLKTVNHNNQLTEIIIHADQIYKKKLIFV